MKIDLLHSFGQIINALSRIIALENKARIFHARRVAIMATEVARKIMPESLEQVFYAGLLHDVGKIGIDEESSMLVAHPLKSAKIVAEIPGLSVASEIIRDHHERWDGQGYPANKSNVEINELSQCLRIADAYDTCLRDNPQTHYLEILPIIGQQKNKEFSATIYNTFVDTIYHAPYCQEINRDECLAGTVADLQKNLPQLSFKDNSDVIGITLRVFARVIDAKHAYTHGHSQRVAQYSMLLAEALGLDHDQISCLKWASLLHDAGKVAIPPIILNKPGPLDEQEFAVVKRHPVVTAEIIKIIDAFKEIDAIVLHHHEFCNGQGYPDELKEPQIPFSSKIISVADAFDAMTSPRPYQKMRSISEALSELIKGKNKQFSGEVLERAQEVFLGLTI